MRNIDITTQFKRDMKRELRGKYRKLLMKGGELDEVKYQLAMDIPLPAKYRDHALHNNLEGLRECHLRHDFLLVYSYRGTDLLILEGLGTHSDLLGL